MISKICKQILRRNRRLCGNTPERLGNKRTLSCIWSLADIEFSKCFAIVLSFCLLRPPHLHLYQIVFVFLYFLLFQLSAVTLQGFLPTLFPSSFCRILFAYAVISVQLSWFRNIFAIFSVAILPKLPRSLNLPTVYLPHRKNAYQTSSLSLYSERKLGSFSSLLCKVTPWKDRAHLAAVWVNNFLQQCLLLCRLNKPVMSLDVKLSFY